MRSNQFIYTMCQVPVFLPPTPSVRASNVTVRYHWLWRRVWEVTGLWVNCYFLQLKQNEARQPIYRNFRYYSEDAKHFLEDFIAHSIHSPPASSFPFLRNQVRGGRPHFVGVRRKTMRIKLVSAKSLHLKMPNVIQKNARNKRFQTGCPHLCFNFHF